MRHAVNRGNRADGGRLSRPYLVIVAAVLSLNAPAQQDPAVIRTSTRLIQVSVIVQDKKGLPVSGLTMEDFTVFENGKPRAIAFFSEESRDSARIPSSSLPANTFSNRPGDNAVPRNVTCILLDGLSGNWGNSANARRQVLKFLKQVRPEDHIAIYRLGRELRLLDDYSSDGALRDLNEGSEIRASSASLAHNRTVRALELIASHLAGIPGRKNLIWVTPGFPSALWAGLESVSAGAEVDHATRALNNANVAIYPVDVRGLLADPGNDAGSNGYRSPREVSRGRPLFTPPNIDTMIEFASRTGGRAFYNRNDLDTAIRTAVDESRLTYTLAYYPEAASDGKFHNIQVHANRPGVTVRHRKGYYALPDLNEDEKTRNAGLTSAASSSLEETAVPIQGRVNLSADGIQIRLQIDNITLTQQERLWRGNVDILFAQRTEDGTALGLPVDHVELKLSGEPYLRVQKEGYIYERKLQRDPRASTLRIVVRDAPTGATGSLTVPYDRLQPTDQAGK